MIKKKIIAIAFAAAAFAVSCSVEEMPSSGGRTPVIKEIPEDAIAGELIVKFAPEVSDILDDILPATRTGGPATRSGVVSVDEVLDLVGTYQIERVFPKNNATEEKTKANGLDLWYLVKYSKDFSDVEVAAKLSALGEVSKVTYNREIRRASERKAMPLTASAVQDAKASAARESYPFDDKYTSLQWNIINDGNMFVSGEVSKSVAEADVHVQDAWKLTKGNPSIIVAVLDEGVCIEHEDLKDNIWINEDEPEYGANTDTDGNGYRGDRYGYNFALDCPIISWDDIYDTGHGSHVAGVIAAQNDNGKGITSIAGGTPSEPGVKIMVCQIFSGNKQSSMINQLRAIKYAADNGAVVLQCSWGYPSGRTNPAVFGARGYESDEEWLEYSPVEKETFDYFIHQAGSPNGIVDGGIAVFAAGNEYAGMAGYPGKYRDYISVAATAADFTPAVYTNFGPGTNISAPGGDQDYYFDDPLWGGGVPSRIGEKGCILSTVPVHVSNNENGGDYATTDGISGYGYMQGTSMACPHVSGVVALGLSYAAKLYKHFKAEEIISLLYESANPAVYDAIKGKKIYWDYSTGAGDNNMSFLDLKLYGETWSEEHVPSMVGLNDLKSMGYGQVDAYNFLKLIEGSGAEMKFPNVFVAEEMETALRPSLYFDGTSAASDFKVSIADASVASASYDKTTGILTVTGLKAGNSEASISCGNEKLDDFIITVRKSGNGWL